MLKLKSSAYGLFALVVAAFTLSATTAAAQTPSPSVLVTWTCTGTPCPWGSPLTDEALVWPAELEAIKDRLGYTTSHGIYLPAAAANGLTVSVQAGVANVFAGEPGVQSFRMLATIWDGESYEITGVAAGEVVTVQGPGPFVYTLLPPGSTPPPDDDPGDGEPTTPPGPPASAFVTWTCTDSPCPWGSQLTGDALVWPADMTPQTDRLGYTTSHGIYLPAARANGSSITLLTGNATAYAGHPDADSFRVLGNLSPGTTFVASGLGASEVLSIQGSAPFSYELIPSDPSNPPAGDPPGDPGPTPPDNTSEYVIWWCTGVPCPWGAPLTGEALVWPEELEPTTERLGYSVSRPIYLPASAANRVTVNVVSGAAAAYAGFPGANSFRTLGAITPGSPLVVSGLAHGEVLTVQGDFQFVYEITLGDGVPEPPDPDPGDPGEPDPSDPDDGGIGSQEAFWRCNVPECEGSDWLASVISWPSWAAYEWNARSGNNSRTVYSAQGDLLYPYMGPWANGCEVTVLTGAVLIIEWERGTDLWRETRLQAGQTHVITLLGTENGAMIETDDGPGQYFRVALQNCTPQPVPR
jgi:hypothetical protein